MIVKKSSVLDKKSRSNISLKKFQLVKNLYTEFFKFVPNYSLGVALYNMAFLNARAIFRDYGKFGEICDKILYVRKQSGRFLPSYPFNLNKSLESNRTLFLE